MITPSTTPRRYPKQSPSNKPSWLYIFLPSAKASRKQSQRHSTIPIVFKSLNPRGTPSHFHNQQPVGLHTFPLMECQAIKLLTFLVVAQVITLVAVHQLL